MSLFSLRYVVFLGGTAVAAQYLVDRILAEFAAAALVFASKVELPLGQGNDGDLGIPFLRFHRRVHNIVQQYSPDLSEFLSRRTTSQHKDFLWSGPEIRVLLRTEDLASFMKVFGDGELLDLPGCPIYLEAIKPAATASLGKRSLPMEDVDLVDEQSKKRRC